MVYSQRKSRGFGTSEKQAEDLNNAGVPPIEPQAPLELVHLIRCGLRQVRSTRLKKATSFCKTRRASTSCTCPLTGQAMMCCPSLSP
jgi:hypothetical protein